MRTRANTPAENPATLYYPEYNDKTDNISNVSNEYQYVERQTDNRYQSGKKYFQQLFESRQLPCCSKGHLVGQCESGHAFSKITVCGREYCPDCGKDGSPTHQQRFNRWMPKVRQLYWTGYMVITIPEQLRIDFLDAKLLSLFRTALKRKLQRLGYKRGLMRWHFYGDCTSCMGRGCLACDGTGSGRVYKPHLNVIFDQGFIKDINRSDFMVELKAFLSGFWRKQFNRQFPPNVHFQFTREESQVVHIVKYVTRSTFRIYNARVAEELDGYRATTTWGKWDKDELVNEEEQLDNGCCPMCAESGIESNINWKSYQRNLPFGKVVHLKNGIYHVQTAGSRNTDPNYQKIPGADRRRFNQSIRWAVNGEDNRIGFDIGKYWNQKQHHA